jgi:hypothetical protein
MALPPWQRPVVWTEAQQILLLDSLVRGVSIGAITLWHPPHNTKIEARDFLRYPVKPQAQFVIDGQQRLSTLLAADRGDLDHFRWDGQQWHEGSGFMVPSQAVSRNNFDFFSRFQDAPKMVVRRCIRDREAVSDHEVTFMTLDGSMNHMLETYERLATCGSPHSVEDLSHMRQWVERQK